MKRIFGLLLTLMPNTMAILVMEFSRGDTKLERFLATHITSLNLILMKVDL